MRYQRRGAEGAAEPVHERGLGYLDYQSGDISETCTATVARRSAERFWNRFGKHSGCLSPLPQADNSLIVETHREVFWKDVAIQATGVCDPVRAHDSAGSVAVLLQGRRFETVHLTAIHGNHRMWQRAIDEGFPRYRDSSDVHGIHEVRGSTPLSSTVAEKVALRRERRRAFLLLGRELCRRVDSSTGRFRGFDVLLRIGSKPFLAQHLRKFKHSRSQLSRFVVHAVQCFELKLDGR